MKMSATCCARPAGGNHSQLTIHLPSSADEARVAHDHADVVYALPLTPRLLGTLTNLDEVARPPLLVRLAVQDEADTDIVPQPPADSTHHEEGLPEPG